MKKFPNFRRWYHSYESIVEGEIGTAKSRYQQERKQRRDLLIALYTLLDATEDGDIQEIGGKPLEAARALAEKALS